MRHGNRQLAYADERIAAFTATDPRVRRLRSVPSVGPVTAAAFVAALDDAQRFRRAHEVEAYLGLVPQEWSSGESQRRGRITKAGSRRVRWLLIQAAVSMRRLRDPRTAGLREWAERIAARRGRKIAVVALARRLAGILFALLRDGTVYESRLGQGPPPAGRAGLSEEVQMMKDVAALPHRLHTRPWPGRTGMITYSDPVDSRHASQSHDLRATHISVSPLAGGCPCGPDVSESHLREQGRKVTETTPYRPA